MRGLGCEKNKENLYDILLVHSNSPCTTSSKAEIQCKKRECRMSMKKIWKFRKMSTPTKRVLPPLLTERKYYIYCIFMIVLSFVLATNLNAIPLFTVKVNMVLVTNTKLPEKSEWSSPSAGSYNLPWGGGLTGYLPPILSPYVFQPCGRHLIILHKD